MAATMPEKIWKTTYSRPAGGAGYLARSGVWKAGQSLAIEFFIPGEVTGNNKMTLWWHLTASMWIGRADPAGYQEALVGEEWVRRRGLDCVGNLGTHFAERGPLGMMGVDVAALRLLRIKPS
ncbi:hypothetical protein EMCG_02342 [[Emmonsia] crescens]|uniref:Uncharacterized protein n=1 Tax=[Emmonsia] crescens TaxID=73230 RepID=A0A0G2J945_9EURO|nr:hypothetical protein EMCG_02342 [Emmonsia crescens UAMH 3008]